MNDRHQKSSNLSTAGNFTPSHFAQQTLNVSRKQGRTYETIGGVGGAAGFALCGSVFGPVGTVVGALLGSVIGTRTGQEVDKHQS